MFRVFLVGLPGSGKSTVGKKISKALKLKFIDLDQFIEQKENCSIPDLFNIQGEAYFREAEKNALNELIESESNFILSTGGGTPCFFTNMNSMLENGTVIFLKPPLGMISSRLAKAKKKRPLFKGLGSEEIEKKIQELFEKRKLQYEKAQIQFNQEDESFSELISKLKNQYNKLL